MKVVEFSALISESFDSLQKKLKEARRDLLKLRMGVKTDQEKNTSKYTSQKKLIAQILTAMRSKELSELVV